MMRWILIGLVGLWGASAAWAQPNRATVLLQGEVVSLGDERPVTDIDLRLQGVGPVRVGQSGTFVVEIPREAREVHLVLVGDATRAILYPPDGRVPVPNDERTPVTIVVGRSTRDMLLDEFASRYAQIATLVERHGQQYRTTLSEVDSLLRQALDVRADEFQASVAFHREKLAVVPPLMEVVDAYTNEVKDIRDALKLFTRHAPHDLAAVLALQAAMTEYNNAYLALNRERNAAPSRVRSLWAGADGAQIADTVSAFFTAAQALHETYVLGLNQQFVVVQLAHSADPPSDAALDAALQALRQAATALDTEIYRLDAAKQAMFGALNAAS